MLLVEMWLEPVTVFDMKADPAAIIVVGTGTMTMAMVLLHFVPSFRVAMSVMAIQIPAKMMTV